MHPVAALVRDLYELRQQGKINDAEALWILSIVLPEYGLTASALAGILRKSP